MFVISRLRYSEMWIEAFAQCCQKITYGMLILPFFHIIVLSGIHLWGDSSHINIVLKLQNYVMNKSCFKSCCRNLFITEEMLSYLRACACV